VPANRHEAGAQIALLLPAESALENVKRKRSGLEDDINYSGAQVRIGCEWLSRPQPVLPMMLPISSAVKARIVFVRTLPRDATWRRAAVAVSSSGNSVTVTMSYSPTV
jgi:hypothetical protein